MVVCASISGVGTTLRSAGKCSRLLFVFCYPNIGYMWCYFKTLRDHNLWKRWQTAVVLQKIRWSQKGRAKLSAFWLLNNDASSNPNVTVKKLSWSYVETMELIFFFFFKPFTARGFFGRPSLSLDMTRDCCIIFLCTPGWTSVIVAKIYFSLPLELLHSDF